MSQENLSSRFATRVDSNQTAHKNTSWLESEISNITTTVDILSGQRTTKALKRLICAFVVRIWHNRFSEGEVGIP